MRDDAGSARAGRGAGAPLEAGPDRAGAPTALQEPGDWRPTVWFAPWQYRTTDEVYAGLGHEIVTQITGRMTPLDRELFWARLNLSRVDLSAVRRRLYQVLATRLVPALVVLVLTGVVTLGLLSLAAVSGTASHGARRAAAAVAGLGTAGTTVSALVSLLAWRGQQVAQALPGLVQPVTLAGRTATGGVADVRGPASGSSRLGLVRAMHDDLRRVLDLVATPERPLVVFIDDLDRCSPAAVAQVVEAMNLVLAGDLPHCIFVLGMDPALVAANLECAHEALAKAVANDPDWAGVGLGWRFLDKMVQLPISLHAPDGDTNGRFVAGFFDGPDRRAAELPVRHDLVPAYQELIADASPDASSVATATAAVAAQLGASGEVAQGALETAARAVLRRRLSWSDPDVQRAVASVGASMPTNPRDVKRFVNILMFSLALSVERQLALRRADVLASAQESRAFSRAPSIEQIAKLAVLAARWPRLLRVLDRPCPGARSVTLLEALEEEVPGGEGGRARLAAWLAERRVAADVRAAVVASEDLVGLLLREPGVGHLTPYL